MQITVDDAEKAIIAAAEQHEQDHITNPEEPPFCLDNRAAHVAHLMYNLGLSLEDLGLVASHFMDFLLDDDSRETPPDDWADEVECGGAK